MNTIRIAFSCTCQPNMNDVQPQMATARMKSLVVLDLNGWFFKGKLLNCRWFRLFSATQATYHIVSWVISQYTEPSLRRSMRTLLSVWLWAARCAHTPAPVRQCSMRSPSPTLSLQSTPIYRPHCTMPRNWEPNRNGISRAWMETVAIEPTEWSMILFFLNGTTLIARFGYFSLVECDRRMVRMIESSHRRQ